MPVPKPSAYLIPPWPILTLSFTRLVFPVVCLSVPASLLDWLLDVLLSLLLMHLGNLRFAVHGANGSAYILATETWVL
jgi:hypothetical protein